jgi:hypothetical protein
VGEGRIWTAGGCGGATAEICCSNDDDFDEGALTVHSRLIRYLLHVVYRPATGQIGENPCKYKYILHVNMEHSWLSDTLVISE